MYLFKYAASLENFLRNRKASGLKVGFVPTMGALHLGHMSLIKEALNKYDQVVCSIFVNPKQFNDPSDLVKYPRSLESDLAMLYEAGAHAVYFPDVEDVYPAGKELTSYDFGKLETLLEGEHRPGHFAGVGVVVARLLQIVQPDGMFLGEKDYQQCRIIESLVRQMGWQEKVQLHFCPTSRESNGLAMSSRNQRLTVQGKEEAAQLYLLIQACQERYLHFSPTELSEWAMHTLEALPNTEPEYVSFADANTLEAVHHWNESAHVRVLIAAWVDGVRLIDNAPLF